MATPSIKISARPTYAHIEMMCDAHTGDCLTAEQELDFEEMELFGDDVSEFTDDYMLWVEAQYE